MWSTFIPFADACDPGEDCLHEGSKKLWQLQKRVALKRSNINSEESGFENLIKCNYQEYNILFSSLFRVR